MADGRRTGREVIKTMNSSLAVANWFISQARAESKYLTQMQLHKLVYFAHALHLAATNEPLVSDVFTASEFGPVAEELFSFTKGYGPNFITNPVHRASPDLGLEIPVLPSNSTAVSYCKEAWKHFGGKDRETLGRISHEKGAPWEQVYSVKKFGIIPNTLIASYYKINNFR
jgi:uncharacterized phage-associated protein